jgi:hypothetical protein
MLVGQQICFECREQITLLHVYLPIVLFNVLLLANILYSFLALLSCQHLLSGTYNLCPFKRFIVPVRFSSEDWKVEARLILSPNSMCFRAVSDVRHSYREIRHTRLDSHLALKDWMAEGKRHVTFAFSCF